MKRGRESSLSPEEVSRSSKASTRVFALSLSAEGQAKGASPKGFAGADLSATQLGDWKAKVTSYLATGVGSRPLQAPGDEGTRIGLLSEPQLFAPWVSDVSQAFVNFFGDSKTRVDRSLPVFEQVNRSGCHWACTYGKRPMQVRDGALLFVSRLVRNSNDIMVYGRVMGMRYRKGRDDASPADIQARSFKKKGHITSACIMRS